MGAALYIVLEKQIPGLDTMVDGKMLSNAEKRLAEAATRLDVRPLMEFFSMNPEEAGGFLEGEGLDDVGVPAEQWFSAEEGLRTVQALLGEAESCSELKNTKEDLVGFEQVLREVQENGVRWHLAVDV
jgi:hypothetical protein